MKKIINPHTKDANGQMTTSWSYEVIQKKAGPSTSYNGTSFGGDNDTVYRKSALSSAAIVCCKFEPRDPYLSLTEGLKARIHVVVN
ncbi:hypothetical protein PoB_007429000 [Plakobranchus ocellatus]|uniref:Uncharacterized protein n=1 Tax=Plakobranchus ocellatus TaxID=259542 RepID=A0AAV4DUE8_9GAST|nr:hypothetical protein PoB_007429000 [Plakobranchus ocellatus]